jgi:hypothetical protein
MKKVLLLILCSFLISSGILAQLPQKFNYQAIARDASGNLIANQSVAFRISILQGTAGGSVVYQETHLTTTNSYGQATLIIGAGSVVSGIFSTIGWGSNQYYIKTEMDPAGGNAFIPMGITQLLSVPYALYSGSTGGGYTAGTGIGIAGTTITNTSPDQTVSLNSGTGIATSGTYPNFNIANTLPNATHTGDATGSSVLTVVKIQGKSVSVNTPANGQVLKWNSTASLWQPSNEDNTTSSIMDTDGDTKVQTEKNQNENKIRFDLGGTERWVMNGSSLEPKNSGSSVFIGDGAGASDDLTDNRNNYIGYQAGNKNTSGIRNMAHGFQALFSNTTGGFNIAVGNMSLYYNKAKSRSTAMGYYAMYNADSSSVAGISTYNSAFGYEALRGSMVPANNTGIQNTAIGDQAITLISSGSDNTALGKSAGYNITTGSQNVLLGSLTGDNITTGSNNILIGYNIEAPSATGNNQVVIGHQDLFYGDINNKFIGIGTTTPHAPLQFANSTASRKIVLYESANNDHQFSGFGYDPYQLRYQVASTGYDHVFCAGSSASSSNELMRISGNGNVGIGVYPVHKLSVGGTLGILEGGTSPTYYTIFQGGNQSANLTYTLPIAYGTAGQVLSTTAAGVLSWTSAPAINVLKDNDGNTKIQVEESANEDKIRFDMGGAERWVMNGTRLEAKNSGGSIFIGDSTGSSDDLVLNYNVFIGNKAGRNNSSGTYNTAIGNESLYASSLGNHNSAFGNTALQSNTTGSSNNAIGSNALRGNQTGSSNTALGTSALLQNISGNENSALGNGALYNNRTGSGAVAIGFNSMYYANPTSIAFNNQNVAVGYEALRGSATPASNTGNSNTAVGYQSMLSNSTGHNNAALGVMALNANTTGFANTAAGPGALQANISGYNNTACGNNSLTYNQTGFYNSATGSVALFKNEDGVGNTAVGFSSLYENVSGGNNTAIGFQAGNSITGSMNVCMGALAGDNITTGSNNIIIGYGINAPVAVGSNQLVIGSQNLLYGDISNGFIGIGTTSPNAPLQFGNTIESRKVVLYETNDNDHEYYGFGINSAVLRYQVSSTTKAHVFYAGTSATTSDELMRISGNGNVKISNLTTNGTVYSNNGVLTNVNPSDKSLKENIDPFGSTLPLIMKLNPVTFDWKNNHSKGIGFIAQELEQVIPELVGTNNDGTKGIYSVEMIPYLVKALQEQQLAMEAQNTNMKAQETENTKLKQLIESLSKRIEQLENK